MLLHRRSTKENKRKDPIAFVCGVGQTMSTRWLELKRGRKRPYIYRQSGDSSSASLSSCSQGRNARHGKGSKDAIVYQAEEDLIRQILPLGAMLDTAGLHCSNPTQRSQLRSAEVRWWPERRFVQELLLDGESSLPWPFQCP
ncbi:hypothetical protein MAP00_007173 [Monascus purpureus]|nr:hypothetical protein MAP00_007173 [Monascus purpureus]